MKIQVMPSVLFRRFGEEAVLLDLDSEMYFSLNETGALMWEHLAAGRAPEEICTAMTDEFDVEAEQVEADLVVLVEALESAGLVLIHRA